MYIRYWWYNKRKEKCLCDHIRNVVFYIFYDGRFNYKHFKMPFCYIFVNILLNKCRDCTTVKISKETNYGLLLKCV